MQIVASNTNKIRYCSLILFIVMVSMGYANWIKGEIFLALTGFGLLLVADIIDWKGEKRYSLKKSVQIIVIYFFLLIFLTCAIVSHRTIKTHVEWIIIEAFITIRGLVFWGLQVERNLKNQVTLSKLISVLSSVKWRVCLWGAIGGLFIGLSISTLRVIPMWDSREYYIAAQKVIEWDFTPTFFINSNLCGHKSLGYAVLLALGGWLSKDDLIGIHVMQIVTAVGTIIAMECIINILFVKDSYLTKTLKIMLFALSPALLGELPNINVDYGMLLFLTFFVYCYISKQEILEWIFAVFLCFTKETSSFLYIGFVMGIYLRQYIRCSGSGFCRIKNCFSSKQYIKYLSPIVLWLLTVVISNATSTETWSGSSRIKWSGIVKNLPDAFNSFGISFSYIFNRIQHIWVFNFMWVMTLCTVFIFLFGIGVSARNRSFCAMKAAVVENRLFIPAVCSIALFCVISFTYITHNHYRYITPISILTILIFEILISQLLNNKWIINGSLLLISLLFLIQSFVSLDPITNKLGKKIEIGNDELVYYAISFDTSSIMSDYINYNREASQWSVFLEEALKEIQPDKYTLILFPKLPGISSVYQILGFWEDVDETGMFWDENKQKVRTLKCSNISEFEEIPFGIIDKNGEIVWMSSGKTTLSNYDRIYYIDMPSESDNIYSNIEGKYRMDMVNTICYGMWKVNLEKWVEIK